jgi:iron complex outermembrane receptor protein
MRKTPLTLALASALAIPVYAQTPVQTPETPDVLDAVEVAGVRSTPLPQADGSRQSDDLDGTAARSSDTARLLRGIPGLSLQTGGGVSSLPAIRGLGDDRLRITVDGIDLISACGNHMNPPLSYIDPTRVGTIEVFAGITPVSLGGDSIGGTIRVASEEPQFALKDQGLLNSGEAGTFYRSNGNAYGANLSATLAGETFNIHYSGSSAQADDYTAGGGFKPAGPAAAGRGWLDSDEVGSTYYKSVNQSLSMAMRHGEHLLELTYGVQDIPYQGFVNQRMDMTGNDSEQINLRYKGAYAWGSLEARLYSEETQHSMQFGEDKLYWYGPTPAQDGQPGPICGMAPGCYAAGMPMATEGDNTGGSLKASIALAERDVLRLGAEVQNYRLDDYWLPSGRMMWPNTFWNIRDGQRDRNAAYAEWETAWNPRWLTQFGARMEWVEMDAGDVQSYNAMFSQADADAFNAAEHRRSDDNLDLTALARFTPSATRSIEFGLAQKVRSPNLYERYAWSTHGMAMRMVNTAGDGNGYVGNLALKPETAHTASASAHWHDAAQEIWRVKLSAFMTEVDDYVDAERCFSPMPSGGACTAGNLTAGSGFVYLRFVNQTARLYGFDASAELPLGRSGRFGSFSGRGVLNYVRGENRSTGDNLYNIMPLNADLSVEQKIGRWTNTLEAELVSAKNEVSQTRNEVRTTGYGLLHLRSRVAWQRFSVDFGVENLFDRLYRHPLGGAYLGQGKTMPATDVPWGVAVPGMGRSVYAGLTLTF